MSKSRRSISEALFRIEQRYISNPDTLHAFFRLKLHNEVWRLKGAVSDPHFSKRRVFSDLSDIYGSQANTSFLDLVLNAIGKLIHKVLWFGCSFFKDNRISVYFKLLIYVHFLVRSRSKGGAIKTKPFYSSLRIARLVDFQVYEYQHGIIYSFHPGYFPIPSNLAKVICSKPFLPVAKSRLSSCCALEGNVRELKFKRLISNVDFGNYSSVVIIDQPAFESEIIDFFSRCDFSVINCLVVKLHPNRSNNPYPVKELKNFDELDENSCLIVGVNSTLLFELIDRFDVLPISDSFSELCRYG